MKQDQRGFSFLEMLIAMSLLMLSMTIAFGFFMNFSTTIRTESTALASQQAGRVVMDELVRSARQAGYGVRRGDSYNPAAWQRGLVFGGAHALAFNADIDPAIGELASSQSIQFPGGFTYTGEGGASSVTGAETYVYTVDADDNTFLDLADRVASTLGSYNPAGETENPLDFAIFRKVHGYNGTNYGGSMEPLAPGLFTNAASGVSYPDGTTPDPLFTYWLTEDLNGDGILSPAECVNDVVGSCPPATTRAPRLYIWGDNNFDGFLSDSEKDYVRTRPVASTGWPKSPIVSGGAYVSTSLAASIDPTSATAYLASVSNATNLGPGYHIELGSGSTRELLFVEQVVTTTTPDLIQFSTIPLYSHTSGETVRVVPSTLLQAVRTVGITFTSITHQRDSAGNLAVAGRSWRKGTRGLDYRITPFHRKVEIINAATAANPAGP